MPNSNKSEYRQGIYDWPLTSSKGDIDVSYYPAIETSVPGAPEGHGGVIVAHAAEHVFGCFDCVCHCPEAEEAPGEQ